MSKLFIENAKKFIGLHERKDNKELMTLLNLHSTKKIDPSKTAWCAYFVNAILDISGFKGTNSSLARSYLKWGKSVDLKDIEPGDIVVFKRGILPWQGHVSFFTGNKDLEIPTEPLIECLGGNQSDTVCIKWYAFSQVIGIRREV